MMHTIKLDVKDSVFDKVMFILRNLPKNDVQIKIENNETKDKKEENIVDFFQNSPLKGELKLDKNEEVYTARIAF